ncbi:hypothetical protein AVEN_266806-1 [Araneus ventricosus]|uniref:Uncharacterized protein n=1 Tax=Araneus ventricosus TaxID=182803 RepID=A0A4Y2HCX5_ARAVE|nr:hypothetical protein AVEN_266806-1 [Araneus ventricosus]
MSHFEATRGLLQEELRHIEPRSDDEDDIWTGIPPFQVLAPHYTSGRTFDLPACRRTNKRRIFSETGFRARNPPVEIIPVGRRGTLFSRKQSK